MHGQQNLERLVFDSQWSLQSLLTPVLEGWRRHQALTQAQTDQIMATAQAEKEAEKTVLPYLIERGWYITYCFYPHLFVPIENFMRAGNHDEVDKIMCSLARERLERTEKELTQRFPDRGTILADAFQIHRDGMFTLSIPAFLGQADGIGCQILGIPRFFFRGEKRKRVVDEILSRFTEFGKPYLLCGIDATLLRPLLEGSSLETDTDIRTERQSTDPWFGPLNRHGVLHGLDLDYPTEANSLRSTTLLQYLLNVDEILNKQIPESVAESNRIWEEALTIMNRSESTNPE